MTATPAADTDVDLSDLDLLNTGDNHFHARCPLCHPQIKWGDPYTTICGKQRIWRSKHNGTHRPKNACPTCIKSTGCPTCGYTP